MTGWVLAAPLCIWELHTGFHKACLSAWEGFTGQITNYLPPDGNCSGLWYFNTGLCQRISFKAWLSPRCYIDKARPGVDLRIKEFMFLLMLISIWMIFGQEGWCSTRLDICAKRIPSLIFLGTICWSKLDMVDQKDQVGYSLDLDEG